MGTPSWAGPLTTSLRGLWVSGYLLRAMANLAQGRRPDNRPGGDDSDPGLASRRERGLNCHQTEYSRTSVDCTNAKRGGGPKTPMCEGKGPENPGVVSPFAVAGCRGNLRRGGAIRYDVAASYYLLWYDTGGRRTTGIFILTSSPFSLLALGFCSLSFSFSSAVVFQFQIASFDTLSVRENAAQFLFWVSLVLWRTTLTTGW